jgi:hypothetical protein
VVRRRYRREDRKETEMTVLHRRVTTGGKTVGMSAYIIVGFLALGMGIGIAVGVRGLVGVESVNPSEIAAVRADEFAELMQNHWIAEVNATKSEDLVSHHRNAFYAGVALTESQRAQDLADHLEGQFNAKLFEIQLQRSEDMATYRFGGSTR